MTYNGQNSHLEGIIDPQKVHFCTYMAVGEIFAQKPMKKGNLTPSWEKKKEKNLFVFTQ